MNISEIKELLKAFDKSSTTALSYEDENGKISLKKEFLCEGSFIQMESNRSLQVNGSTDPLEKNEGAVFVKSPIVGVVYSSPEPDAPPFVAVGEKIQKGQKLCIVEAMKMFNDITAPCSGTIISVLFQNGDLVEYDKPLFEIGA